MTHWKETLIKSSDIQWKRPRMKSTDDDRLDFDLHLPFTGLFNAQAKRAFAAGMMAMLQFHVKQQEDKHSIEVGDLIALFNECGLPEVAKQFVKDETE